MWRNAATGEFVVVQGAERFVTATWKGDALFAHGRWELVKHYHPGDPKIARFPSRQDFRALRRQLVEQHTSGEEPTGYVRSTIDYVDEQGNRQQTTFGYDMENGYFVQFVGPDGKQHSERLRRRAVARALAVGAVPARYLGRAARGAADRGHGGRPRCGQEAAGDDPDAGLLRRRRSDAAGVVGREVHRPGHVGPANRLGRDPHGHRVADRRGDRGHGLHHQGLGSARPSLGDAGGVPGHATEVDRDGRHRDGARAGRSDPPGDLPTATADEAAAACEYAELRKREDEDIENVRAICQMEAGRRAARTRTPASARRTPWGTTRPRSSRAATDRLRQGATAAARAVRGPAGDRLEAETPGLRAEHDAILAEYGIKRADHVLYGFDIDLQTRAVQRPIARGRRGASRDAPRRAAADRRRDRRRTRTGPRPSAQRRRRASSAWPRTALAGRRDGRRGARGVRRRPRRRGREPPRGVRGAGLAARTFVVARPAGRPAGDRAAHGVAGACDVRTMLAWDSVADPAERGDRRAA